MIFVISERERARARERESEEEEIERERPRERLSVKEQTNDFTVNFLYSAPLKNNA